MERIRLKYTAVIKQAQTSSASPADDLKAGLEQVKAAILSDPFDNAKSSLAIDLTDSQEDGKIEDEIKKMQDELQQYLFFWFSSFFTARRKHWMRKEKGRESVKSFLPLFWFPLKQLV
jgi:hypothetical protein